MHSSLRVRFVLLAEFACTCVAPVYRARECVTISDILWYACTRVHLCIYRSCNFFPRQDLYRFIDTYAKKYLMLINNKYFFVNLFFSSSFSRYFFLLFWYFFNSKWSVIYIISISSFNIFRTYIYYVSYRSSKVQFLSLLLIPVLFQPFYNQAITWEFIVFKLSQNHLYLSSNFLDCKSVGTIISKYSTLTI